MPYNGSGVFSVYTPGNPVVTGTVISSTVANATNSDFATGLTNAITKDGQTTITASIKFFAGTVSVPGISFASATNAGLYYIGADNIGLAIAGAKVLDLSATGLGITGAVTPTGLVDISGAAAGQIKFPATQNASSNANTLDDYEEGTFTPTVTLVGGAGNTVPVYSTNTGRYTKIGNRVFIDIYLTGDGGAEGAGTGQITIALPVACNASFPAGSFVIGRSSNNANSLILFGSIASTSLTVAYQQTISVAAALTGDDQNNTSRSIRLSFSYEA